MIEWGLAGEDRHGQGLEVNDKGSVFVKLVPDAGTEIDHM